jgi:hypothetical protein
VPACVRQPAEGDVDARWPAVVPQQAEVVTGPAAAVQDTQAAPAGAGPLEQRRHEPAKAVEPEVVALGARGGIE